MQQNMDTTSQSTSYRIFWIFLVILFLFVLSYWNSSKKETDIIELSDTEESVLVVEEKPPVWKRPYQTSVLQIPQNPNPEPVPTADEPPFIVPQETDEVDEPTDYVAYVDESNDADIGGEIVRTDDEPEIPGTPPPTPPCMFECFP